MGEHSRGFLFNKLFQILRSDEEQWKATRFAHVPENGDKIGVSLDIPGDTQRVDCHSGLSQNRVGFRTLRGDFLYIGMQRPGLGQSLPNHGIGRIVAQQFLVHGHGFFNLFLTNQAFGKFYRSK